MTRLQELREILADRREELEMAKFRRSQAGHRAYVDDLDYEVERAERRLDFFWDDYSLELAEAAMEEIQRRKEANHDHEEQDRAGRDPVLLGESSGPVPASVVGLQGASAS